MKRARSGGRANGLSSASSRARGKPTAQAKQPQARRAAAPRKQQAKLSWENGDDEQLSDDDDDDDDDQDDGANGASAAAEDEDDARETADQKRLRLANQYLEKLAHDLSSGDDDSEVEEEEGGADAGGAARGGRGGARARAALGDHLARERLRAAGELRQTVAAALGERGAVPRDAATALGRRLSGPPRGVPTCLALSADDGRVVVGSKDNSLTVWHVETSTRRVLAPRWPRTADGAPGAAPDRQQHEGEVLAVAWASPTDDGGGQLLASAGREGVVRLWDARCGGRAALVAALQGHRGAVTALAFREGSPTLLSGSADRTIKHWDARTRAYVESLFGHQEAVTALAPCGRRERCVSAGADRSARLWKLAEETQVRPRARHPLARRARNSDRARDTARIPRPGDVHGARLYRDARRRVLRDRR